MGDWVIIGDENEWLESGETEWLESGETEWIGYWMVSMAE